MKIIGMMICLMVIFSAPQHVMADEDERESSIVCGAVGAAIGALVGMAVTKGAYAAVKTAAMAASTYVGAETTKKCKNPNLQSWDYSNYRWPAEYDDFVRIQCNGNPMNCPGTLNIHQPSACSYYTSCMVNLLPQGGISVQDLLAVVYEIGTAVEFGTWLTPTHTIDIGW